MNTIDLPANLPATENAGAILNALVAVRRAVAAEAEVLRDEWTRNCRRRAFYISASNLSAYLALRRRDLRPLQAALGPLGLSTLGHSESHVLATVDAVLSTLGAITGVPAVDITRPPARAFARGTRRLTRNTEELFGPSSARSVRIMVTLPSEAATDYELVHRLVGRGMDCARVNCAHDDRDAWIAMAGNVRRAGQALGRPCRVLMDLAGRKVRVASVVVPERGARLVQGQRFRVGRAPLAPLSGVSHQVALVPDILDHLAIGRQIWIDDGRLGAKVESVDADGAILMVTGARVKGEKLRPDQGVNVPGVRLGLACLTERDLVDLDTVLPIADIVGYSFVELAADVRTLQDEMTRRLPAGVPLPRLVVKLEARAALRQLPSIIAAAASRQPVGVMIARGDLAVEIGYERLAEIQEEILWVCEAAHTPVIWATQVLEQFVKNGTPSRAEVTDAAMSARAECVMLNKGPYLDDAVTLLDHVLTRMQGHLQKKAPQLRALGLWQHLTSTVAEAPTSPDAFASLGTPGSAP
jgi:pyruvate kinase